MNCLKDYIGVRGCGLTPPESGQFINQLQGISLVSIQLIADSEQVTFVKVWDDVQERSWIRLRSDFLVAMRSKYCITKDIDTDAIICSDKALFARAWLYVLASELMQERIYSERVNKLTTIDHEAAQDLEALFADIYQKALAEIIPAIEYVEPDFNLHRSHNRVERLP